MAFYQDLPWHEGEEQIAKSMDVPHLDNPTIPTLSPQLANHLRIAPLIAIGTVDAEKRPWVTLLGGQKGMSQPLGNGIVGIKTAVTGKYDPVVEELVGKDTTGDIIKEEGQGRMVSGLTIDLETRKRVKMYGRMIAGALSQREDELTGHEEHIAEMQLVLKVEQSLGNCPKYLNKKHIEPTSAKPRLSSDWPQLPQQALDLVEKADLFFVSSAQHDQDMDANHRGGPPGFLRVASNEVSGAVLIWPEYSGNRLYQTLGNLALNPVAGLCVPDFDTGDMLYLTGTTEILVGKDAAAVLPRSNLCVRLTVTAARFVLEALPFRGTPGERSPYNPVVRFLTTEKPPPQSATSEIQQATLISQTTLTPTVSRFRFSLENAASYKAGQYVTLDFSEHLFMGYQHMADEDPWSINDDFVRTFTVSSPPGDPPNPVRKLEDDEFEITIRKVGVTTDFLFKHQGAESDRMKLEIGVKGFGGEFEVQQQDGEEKICFIAAGVGITPILPSLWRLAFERLELLWTIRKEDIGLVMDTLEQHPNLHRSLQIFVTNAEVNGEEVERLKSKGVNVQCRRMQKGDLEVLDNGLSKYYLCTAVPMRKQLIEWLPSKQLVFEDFNF
ncbi:related to oxidoreductase, FAD-binding [Lecanosticta acicola]|uniref:Related to oxidoreductase, FAD-binding n=1 Tax=Lecanosticta acicola TaxID=111012 RepID=A0AAI9EDB2_9PEZI|nr:related to oxidoreductase, FAD-binding [Lecanosticta acicola]